MSTETLTRQRSLEQRKSFVRSIRNPKSRIQNLLILGCLLLSACATSRPIEPVPGEQPTPAPDVLEQAMLSVVAIVVEHGGTGDAFGAGVIYDEQGHILTAHHVIEDADRILLLIGGGYTVRAEVVGIDPIADFALLKAEAVLPDRMRPAKFAATDPRPGDFVWSLGNPFGTSRYGGEPSVGRGVVSAVNRTYLNDDTGRLYLDSLQHDAPTNPGNSGGGVFNMRGELLGLNALITTTRETPGDSGVAFAIPSHLLKAKAETLLQGRAISHGWFGAQDYRQATEIFPQGFGRLRAVFGPIAPNGPAQMAGVQPGDVIIAVDDVELYGIHEVLMLEDAVIPGQQVRLTINRAGSEFEITIIAGQRPWPFG
ncbi:MAG: trypsin-like peptidase domain-containing protein [Planctomycetes bacterium]|nr:trypsin-like peptidase domain-containing protein [Planctomycetota bacterium]